MVYMNQEQPLRPANIANIVAINKGQKPLTMELPMATALEPSDAQSMLREGGLVIDTRSEAAFGAGHIPNAFNIQLSSSEFEQRVGWVIPLDSPIILVLEDPIALSATLHRLAFLGLDHRVKGYLRGGMAAWMSQGLPIRTLPQLSVQQLNHYLQSKSDMHVLDVREASEWNTGRIEQACHMNFKILAESIQQLVFQPEQHISVVCAGGIRSSIASSILLMHGFEHIYNITGGMMAWKAAALPMTAS